MLLARSGSGVWIKAWIWFGIQQWASPMSVGEIIDRLLARGGFGMQPGADPRRQRKQVGMSQEFHPAVVPRQHHGQQGSGVEVGAGQQPQFAEHFGSHLLGFVDQQHGLDAGGGQMGAPINFSGLQAQNCDMSRLAIHHKYWLRFTKRVLFDAKRNP